jgi:hypothetical protein
MISFGDLHHFAHLMNQFNIEPIRDNNNNNSKRQISSIEEDSNLNSIHMNTSISPQDIFVSNKIKPTQIPNDDSVLSIEAYINRKLSFNDTNNDIDEMIQKFTICL